MLHSATYALLLHQAVQKLTLKHENTKIWIPTLGSLFEVEANPATTNKSVYLISNLIGTSSYVTCTIVVRLPTLRYRSSPYRGVHNRRQQSNQWSINVRAGWKIARCSQQYLYQIGWSVNGGTYLHRQAERI